MENDTLNMSVIDQDLLEVRSQIGDHLVATTGLTVEELNVLSTDAMMALGWAFEETRSEAFSAGVLSGGRDALAIADMNDRLDSTIELGGAGFKVDGFYDEDEAYVTFTEFGDDYDYEALVDADAIVIDALSENVQKIHRRIEELEYAVGLKRQE